jgi:hypothetical protein
MKGFRTLAIALLTLSGIASSQTPATGTWTKLANQPKFQTDTALVLTDGTIMMHAYNSTNWWRLTPDITGNYVNGTWTQLGSMPSGYEPLYFASAIMPDGQVVVEGGEYNNLQQIETNKGAIYNPLTNAWTNVAPPSGWTTIGDSPAIVLPNGTLMMGQGGEPSEKQVYFNESTLTWTAVGTGKADGFSEEGFALLPDGNVLTVDCEDGTNSEIYNPSTSAWSSAGSTIVPLPNSGNLGIVPEMGPLMQRPDGSVVAFGATTNTSIYSSTAGTWTKGPVFPNGNDIADGNAAILPDGNIVVFASPGVFSGAGSFLEFTYPGNTFVALPNTTDGAKLESWNSRMLLLPSGQVMWMASQGSIIDVEVYTENGTVNAAWKPTITSVPTKLTPGSTYTLSGTQLNGLSAGTAYGDDATMGSSYPLVRFENAKTRHIFYGRTHTFSTMGIATGSTVVTTQFDVPSTIETGETAIFVVANGIASAPKVVNIQ